MSDSPHILVAKAGGSDENSLIASAASLSIVAAAGDGKMPTFRIAGYSGAPMMANFGMPVIVDLAGLKAPARGKVPALRDHDSSRIVGQADEIKITPDGAEFSGRFVGLDGEAGNIIKLAASGFEWQASIGANITRREFLEAGKSITINGRNVSGPLIVAREATLREISFVAVGADENTAASIAASRKETSMQFQEWLVAKGFDPATITDAQKNSLKAMFDNECAALRAAGNAGNAGTGGNAAPPAGGNTVNGSASTGNQTLDSILRDAEAREARATAITNLTAKALLETPEHRPTIQALSQHAMNSTMSPSEFELTLLRACRPQVGARGTFRQSADEGMTNEVIEAAVMLADGSVDPTEHYPEQVVDAASKRWRHGLGLGELLHTFARRNGYDGMSTRNVEPLLRAAFGVTDGGQQNILRADAPSTLSLPGIMSNVANKFLTIGFESIEATWRQIAAIRSVRDFKTVTSYTLTGDFQYEEVAPGGELKHASPGEQSYSNQAKTYGRLFGIDRRDIINDDLGALTSAPRRLGRGGALKFNLVFWTKFLANSTFFTVARKNLSEGVTAGSADSRMNIEGLTTAELKFLNQTDPDGKPLGLAPKFLLVPNALNVDASVLMRSTEVRNPDATGAYGTSNPHAGKFTVIRSSYLSNAAITGNSATAWYMLADPAESAVIEAAFLNGVQSPTIETATAELNTLGILMRGYHDFGVNLQEYRAGVKSTGVAAA